MSKKLLIGATLFTTVAILGGVAVASRGDSGVEVQTEAVQRRDLVSIVTASGYIQPKRKVEITADISGRVTELAVEEGQWVEKGELLLRIDPTAFQANVRRAEAMIAAQRAQEGQARAQWLQAKSALSRADQLSRGDGLISTEALEQARTQASVAEAQYEAARFGVQQAEASLSEARDQMNKTTIRAPMSGRVTRLNIQAGETAVVGFTNNPGSLLLTIADFSEMEARVTVDETDVPRISVGDSAEIRLDAFPDRRLPGRVTRISHSAVQSPAATAAMASQTGQSIDFEVVVTLDQPPEDLRPDLSASADIVTETRRNALAVPIIAVTLRDAEGKKFSADGEEATKGVKAAEREETEGVFVLEGGKAKFVPVKLGITGDRYFEILSGLKGDETVVSGSYQAIRDLEGGALLNIKGGAAPGAAGDSATKGEGASREAA